MYLHMCLYIHTHINTCTHNTTQVSFLSLSCMNPRVRSSFSLCLSVSLSLSLSLSLSHTNIHVHALIFSQCVCVIVIYVTSAMMEASTTRPARDILSQKIGGKTARRAAKMRIDVPLAALYSKAEAASVQLSPGGAWVGWLARSSSGVLDLFAARLPLPSEGSTCGNSIDGAMQLTATKGRDICFSFSFTKDDTRIVYLRETDHGSELYHLYSIELPASGNAAAPVESGRDLLAAHPKMTCSVR